jgi:outer membrane protein
MTLVRKSIIAIAAISALGIASQSYAQKAGDVIVSLGGALIAPNASLSPLTTTAAVPAVATGVTASLSGATASIDKTSTVTLSALYMWTDNVATELTIGVPPKMTVDVTTPNASSVNHSGAATANVMNPSLVAKYMFNAPNDTIRPYIGLGVTYTSFTNVTPNTSDALVNILASSSASLSSKWAPVFNVGAIYNIDEKWSINGSISYVPLTTDVTFVGSYPPGVPITTTGSLQLNPWDFVLRVGYKF